MLEISIPIIAIVGFVVTYIIGVKIALKESPRRPLDFDDWIFVVGWPIFGALVWPLYLFFYVSYMIYRKVVGSSV